MRKLAFAAALAGAFLAAPLAAQSPAQPAAPTVLSRAELLNKADANFDKYDTNNDGFINRDEMQNAEAKAVQEMQAKVDAKAAEQFAKMDKDKNGQLTLAEFKAALAIRPNETPDQVVAKYDSNKDGKVSPAEFRAPLLGAFDRVDLDKNGTLSPDEQAKAKASRGQ